VLLVVLLVLAIAIAAGILAKRRGSSNADGGDRSSSSYYTPTATATATRTSSSSSSSDSADSASPVRSSSSAPGRSRTPGRAASPTGQDAIDLMNRGDCLDRTLTLGNQLPASMALVACSSDDAVVRITSATRTGASPSCPTGDGRDVWQPPTDEYTYCVERVYRPGQCVPASHSSGSGVYSARLGTVIPCGTTDLGSGYDTVLRIEQVIDDSSASCADGDHLRYKLDQVDTTVCASVYRSP
jgi:hypothetical protein